MLADADGRVIVWVVWSGRPDPVASAVLVVVSPVDEKGQWNGTEDEVPVMEEVGPGPWYGADDG